MRKLISIIFILAVISTYSKNKSQVFEALKKKYAKTEAVKMSFEQENNSGISGEIIAADDNKYRITVPGRIITCDGSSIWNYSYDDDNVIVSNFTTHTENASPERIFFGVLDNYKPIKLVKESNSMGNQLFKLVLQPDSETVADMSEIMLWLDDENNIKKVGIESIYGFEIWNIKQLKTDIMLNDLEFKFNPPSDTEVIDLR
jgi:outer membrane lipoprotein-sorting protein